MLPVEAGARQAAIRAKQGLAQGAGGASDHLALVKAFNGWSAARRAGQERGYCSSNFLSSSTMMMVNGMRTQLLGELQVLLTVQHSKHKLVICADVQYMRILCKLYMLHSGCGCKLCCATA